MASKCLEVLSGHYVRFIVPSSPSQVLAGKITPGNSICCYNYRPNFSLFVYFPARFYRSIYFHNQSLVGNYLLSGNPPLLIYHAIVYAATILTKSLRTINNGGGPFKYKLELLYNWYAIVTGFICNWEIISKSYISPEENWGFVKMGQVIKSETDFYKSSE